MQQMSANNRTEAVNGYEVDIRAAATFEIGEVNADTAQVNCA
jgi:hypothetical protein